MGTGERIALGLVRVRHGGGVVGAGFLVAADLVVTCAHVIPDPDLPVTLDFPLLPGRPEVVGEVVRWVGVAEDGGGDVAVVRVVAPGGAAAVPVAADGDVWGHRLRVLGFPEGYDDGRWLTGTLLGRQGTGWLQAEVDGVVRRGFSGAPVWDDDAGGVVGMLVAGAPDGTAFLIPGSNLGPEWTAAPPEPYRGLAPFEEADEALFHGRDADVERLVDHVRHRGLVLVAGPSGSGKSSLVRAGLVPVLRRDGVAVSVVRHTPGVGARALFADLVAGLGGDRRAVRESLRDAEDIALLAADVRREHGRALLVVDQFEEVVSQDPGLARELLGLLLAVRAADIGVVLTVRSDSLDDLVTPETAAALERGYLLVAPPDADGLRAAVVEPARAVGGVAFEEGLVDRVLADAGGEPGRLPLVEFALTELWRRRSGGLLTHRAYDEIGAVSGALTDYADRVLWRHVEDKDGARRLLTRLVRVRDLTRRRVPLAEVEDRALLAALVRTRLVVVDDGAVELAHQALIDRWDRLRGWLHADREFLAWREELAQRRTQWEASGRDPGSVLGGVALTRALEWQERRPAELPAVDVEFIASGRGRRRRSSRQRALALVAVLALVASVAVLAVNWQDQRRATEAGSLADESRRLLPLDPNAAARTAVRAWRTDPASPQAHSALLNARVALASVRRVGSRSGSLVSSLDGSVVASREHDSGDVVVRGPDGEWRVAAGSGGALALSPDGRTLATASGGEVSLWDVRGRSGPTRLTGTDLTEVWQLRFGPTGAVLTATAQSTRIGAGSVPVVWDTRKGDRHWQGEPEYFLRAVAVSTTRLLVLSYDDTLTERNPVTGEVVREFERGSKLLGNGDAVARCVDGVIRIESLGAREIGAGRDVPCEEGRFDPDITGEFVTVAVPPDLAGTTLRTLRYLHWRSGELYTLRSPFAIQAAVRTASGALEAVLAASDFAGDLHARPDLRMGDSDLRERVFAPDHRTWAVVNRGELLLVDAEDGHVRARRDLPPVDPPRGLTFTRDGRWLVLRGEGRLVVHRADDLAVHRTVDLPTRFGKGGTWDVVAIGGAEVALFADGHLRSWRVDLGQPTGAVPDLAAEPDFVTLDPRPGPPGRLILTTYAGWRAVDLATSPDQWPPNDWPPGVRPLPPDAVLVDPSGSTVAMSLQHGGVVVSDVDSGAQVRYLDVDYSDPVGFHGDLLVLRTNAEYQLWRQGVLIAAVPVPNSTWGAIVFDGRLRLLTSTSTEGDVAEVSVALDARALAGELCGIYDGLWGELCQNW
ncbi:MULTISPECIES: nSTAND1 domain-containing NTPase [unclassified Saccharothrix]|uniref:nSTAND1 domain-containing NTPase n=1 Tax=unclassified Saccharothrix TaxID=2593673 RepID=UPI00307FB623